ARSGFRAHGADAAPERGASLGRSRDRPGTQRREQGESCRKTRRGAARCAPTLLTHHVRHVSLLGFVTSDPAERPRARGRSRRGVVVLVLTRLVDLVTSVHVVVQTIRLVHAFLIELAIIVLPIVALGIRLVYAFLIVLAVEFLDRAGDFALDLHGDPAHHGRLGRGGGGARTLRGEQGWQRQRYDDSQNLAQHGTYLHQFSDNSCSMKVTPAPSDARHTSLVDGAAR